MLRPTVAPWSSLEVWPGRGEAASTSMTPDTGQRHHLWRTRHGHYSTALHWTMSGGCTTEWRGLSHGSVWPRCVVSVSVGSSEALVAVSSCWTQHDVTLSLAATQHDSGQRHNINTAPINANTLPQQQQLTPSILQDWSLMNDEQIVNVTAVECMAEVHGSSAWQHDGSSMSR